METPTPLFKMCNNCRTEKSLDNFHRQKTSKDGKQSRCKECAINLTLRWQAENKDRVNAKNRAWKSANGELVAASARRYSIERGPRTSEYHRYIALRRRGLTVAEFDAIFEAQGGKCAICRKTDNGKKEFAVDHDHSCCPRRGACKKCVRGLLCTPCNTGIHKLETMEDWTETALAYLNRFKKEVQ